MKNHDDFMRTAIELAKKGLGNTSPNPVVGCVIVKNGKIIGKGYHKKAGLDHAEVVALKKAGKKTKGATVYVTLEPCSHWGKTPPCTDALIAAGVRKVIFASKDPHLQKRSTSILKKSKIKVAEGVLDKEGKKLNEHYFHFVKTKKPFVTLKLAMTLDGKIANSKGESYYITGVESRKHVHYLRTIHDAVMVGSGTLLADDPQLTPRLVKGKDPFKIIVDSTLSFSLFSKLLKNPKKLIIVSTLDAANKRKQKLNALRSQKVTVVLCKKNNKRVDLQDMIKKLGGLGIQSVLLEGGSQLAGSMLDSGLVQKVLFFYAPKIMGEGISGISIKKHRTIHKLLKVKNTSFAQLGDDFLIEGYL